MKSIMEVLKSLKIEPLYDAADTYTGIFIYKGKWDEGRSISIPMRTTALTPTANKTTQMSIYSTIIKQKILPFDPALIEIEALGLSQTG